MQTNQQIIKVLEEQAPFKVNDFFIHPQQGLIYIEGVHSVYPYSSGDGAYFHYSFRCRTHDGDSLILDYGELDSLIGEARLTEIFKALEVAINEMGNHPVIDKITELLEALNLSSK